MNPNLKNTCPIKSTTKKKTLALLRTSDADPIFHALVYEKAESSKWPQGVWRVVSAAKNGAAARRALRDDCSLLSSAAKIGGSYRKGQRSLMRRKVR